MSRPSSRIVSYQADVNPTISQVQLSYLPAFQSIAEAPTPATQATAEYMRHRLKDNLRRNEAAILDTIDARLRARLAPRA